MNNTLFSTAKHKLVPNKSGGKTYELSVEQALAQFTVTSTFNNTYYASAEDGLAKFKELLGKVRPVLAAKMAVYGHTEGNMKDAPAFILSYLFSIGELDLVRRIFNRVITNTKMLCNFVQFIRSGVHGRKSFGSAGKALIQNWLTSRSPEQLFKDSIGHSQPSLVDIIKMVHPKFNNDQNNVVRYLLGKDYNLETLPNLIQRFEALKSAAPNSPLSSAISTEGLDFRLLSNLTLSQSQWETIALSMGWNALRMNLNNLQRHNAFQNKEVVDKVAAKLSDPIQVSRANAFPYQLMTAYQNTTSVPQELRNALQNALESATENVPNLGRVAVCVDVSGSMQHPVTGQRVGATTVTRCVDVAGLIASSLLRTSDEPTIIPFDTAVRNISLSRENSVLTNARALAINGGGTACSVALQKLVNDNWRGDVVLVVSDNESWADYDNYNRRNSPFKDYWNRIKGANPNARLILLDLTPNHQSQMHEDKSVLHVAGMSDSVFEVIKSFVSGDGNFLKVIENVSL